MRNWRVYWSEGFIEYVNTQEAKELVKAFQCEVSLGFRTLVLL